MVFSKSLQEGFSYCLKIKLLATTDRRENRKSVSIVQWFVQFAVYSVNEENGHIFFFNFKGGENIFRGGISRIFIFQNFSSAFSKRSKELDCKFHLIIPFYFNAVNTQTL